MSNKFQLDQFNLENMVIDQSILIVANGNQYLNLVDKLLTQLSNNEENLSVFASNSQTNQRYKNKYTEANIYENICDNTLKTIISDSISKINNTKVGSKKNIKNGVVVFDNCLPKKNNNFLAKEYNLTDNIMEILMNGRHYRLATITIVDSTDFIPPDLRLNYDYIFIGNTNDKKLYDRVGHMFPTQQSFSHILNDLTDNDCYMVSDNRKPSDKITEKIFWFPYQNNNHGRFEYVVNMSFDYSNFGTKIEIKNSN